LPFEAVHDRIAEYLRDKVRRTAVSQYIARLVSGAEITGVAMPDAQDMRVF
jgi:peptidyl-prolyl cis-trans isomerase C